MTGEKRNITNSINNLQNYENSNGCCKTEEARWGFPYKCINEDYKDNESHCVVYKKGGINYANRINSENLRR